MKNYLIKYYEKDDSDKFRKSVLRSSYDERRVEQNYKKENPKAIIEYVVINQTQ